MVLKMNNNDINDFIPSLLNPRCVRKPADLSFTQNSFMSKCSLSLKRKNSFSLNASTHNKENCQNIRNFNSVKLNTRNSKQAKVISTIGNDSLDFTAIKDLNSVTDHSDLSESVFHHTDFVRDPILNNYASKSSNTELDQIIDAESDSTVIYDINNEPTISVSFGINFCDSVDVSANNCTFNRMIVSNNGNNTTVDCEIIETSNVSTDSELEEMIEESPCPQKRCAVAVNLEIKKNKLSTDTEENSKVLILNTSAIKKISHVIVQPPNYKTVKRKLSGKNKFRNVINLGSITNDGASRAKLRQKTLDSFYFKCSSVKTIKVSEERSVVDNGNEHLIRDEVEMSKNLGVADAVRSERVRKSPQKGSRNEGTTVSGRGTRKDSVSPRQEIKTSCSSPRARTDSASVHSPRRNVESIHFSLPPKPVSSKRTASTRTIPQHKIVAGTHFAVDAFSYGDIPNVKHYFLTHFHSDHYCGLKKGFNKLLYCSKITANLCTSRLGVNSKCIHVVNVDEMIKIDDVEVIALEANHCPGAIMLVFTLPNGKTLLHTGDFRASPVMESYPIFWNRDIHTIYLDTTYCNPRYDFPTQEQSLEMAVLILRQKKLALEKLGKSFSSVLIVCGTYTIGKEKFFMGLSRRLGCAVWACPEKDLVLQAVEGGPFSHAAPQSCQLHVVPMRDLTHEKLRSYLDSLKGSFAEVVAFKPSGWENGKSASVEKDAVTVHGIPYSEHSSFSELIRFVKFLQPKQVVPTVDISGGVRAVQKYFPCPLVYKDDIRCQSKLTDFFSIQAQQQVPAVT